MSTNSNKTSERKRRKIPENKIFLDLKSLTAVAILEKYTHTLFGNTAVLEYSASNQTDFGSGSVLEAFRMCNK